MTKTKNTVVQSYDAHVGKKLRIARKAAGLSQTALGELVDLTFQHIQKYEKGLVRISAGRLIQFAKALNAPVQFFFEDLPADDMTRTVAETKLLDLSQVSPVKSECIRLITVADDDDIRPLHVVLKRLTSANIVKSKETLS